MTALQKRGLWVLGVALFAVAGHLAYSFHQLALVRADYVAAEAVAKSEQALDYAATMAGEYRLAEWRAEQAEARADTAEARAQAAEKKQVKSAAKLAALPVPDTCAKIKAAADEAIADAEFTAGAWRLAYQEKEAAAVHYKEAADSAESGRKVAVDALASLRAATVGLRSASKPSLFARLKPKVGGGVAAGVDVWSRPNAVAGVTFGWTFR